LTFGSRAIVYDDGWNRRRNEAVFAVIEGLMINTFIDRRRSRRLISPNEHGVVSARVRPGYDVTVIDLSADGALIESRRRLLPGACVDLHLQSIGRAAEIVRGEILRCAVAGLRENAISYRGAISFERRLWWLARDAAAGYQVLSAGPDPPENGQPLPARRRG
jgi:hypothetical protein